MNDLGKNDDLLAKFHPDAPSVVSEKLLPVFPDLVERLVDDIYGFAYRRNQIDIKTRHLITLGVLCAMGDCQNQLEFQLKAALNLGLLPDEIREVFIQVAVFAGNARAINAALIFDRILQEHT